MMIACVVVKNNFLDLKYKKKTGGGGRVINGVGVNGVCLIVCLFEELDTHNFF